MIIIIFSDAQTSFDQDWANKTITDAGWTEAASSTGVMAYKLLSQTDESDDIDRTQVRTSTSFNAVFWSLILSLHVITGILWSPWLIKIYRLLRRCKIWRLFRKLCRPLASGSWLTISSRLNALGVYLIIGSLDPPFSRSRSVFNKRQEFNRENTVLFYLVFFQNPAWVITLVNNPKCGLLLEQLLWYSRD